jgi:hypothetical protein
MECPYCREDIKDEAAKCKFCNEFLTYKRKIWASLLSFLSILVPIASLSFAGLQYWEKRDAVDQRNDAIKQQDIAEGGKEAAIEILKTRVPRQSIQRALREDLERPKPEGLAMEGYERLESRKYEEAKPILEEAVKENPENEMVQRALIYSEVLQSR